MNAAIQQYDLVQLREEFEQIVDRARQRVDDPALLQEKWLAPRPELFDLYLRDYSELAPSAGASVLDLGTGPGYLLWFCRKLAKCEIVGLEPKRRQDLQVLWNQLQLESCIIRKRVAPLWPLELERRFDFICATRICFDRIASGRWRIQEYLFFILDAAEHLTENGTLYLRFNASRLPAEPICATFRDLGMVQDGTAFRLRGDVARLRDNVRAGFPGLFES